MKIQIPCVTAALKFYTNCNNTIQVIVQDHEIKYLEQ